MRWRLFLLFTLGLLSAIIVRALFFIALMIPMIMICIIGTKEQRLIVYKKLLKTKMLI